MVDISEHGRWNIEKKTVELFLKSRKNDTTRGYTQAIIKCLSDRFDNEYYEQSMNLENAGWVRAKDLIEMVMIIPNESTFYHLLKDLEEANLIEKKSEYKPGLTVEPGKKPVYYRVPFIYTEDILRSFQTKKSLSHELTEALIKICDLSYKLEAARELLKQCHNEEYDADNEIMQLALKIRVEEEEPKIMMLVEEP